MLTHLAHHLGLHYRDLVRLTRLQQLTLWSCWMYDMDLPALASILVGVVCYPIGHTIGIADLPQFTALTELRLQEPIPTGDQQEAHLLSGLSSLQHLRVDTSLSDGWMLEDLNSLSSLRTLEVVAWGGTLKPEALAALGGATQLTSLAMVTGEPGAWSDGAQSQLLQQLTGLQRLRINQGWVMAHGHVLGGLQHLKQLAVNQRQPAAAAPLQLDDLVGALQVWPASLQHLVYLCNRRKQGGLPGQQEPPLEVVPTPLPGVRVTVASHSKPLQFSELQKRPLCHGLNMSGLWEIEAQV